jgi:hypothetical protein
MPGVGPSTAGISGKTYRRVSKNHPTAAGVAECSSHGHLARVTYRPPVLGHLRFDAPDDGTNRHRHEFLLAERHRAAGGPKEGAVPRAGSCRRGRSASAQDLN